ncbi:MAG: VCBS repeat-containing protein [Candidatus Omnitrophica bacterium]|nr:VCBS repeat-containing protein [Candidatus Omnitrophota bacterium]
MNFISKRFASPHFLFLFFMMLFLETGIACAQPYLASVDLNGDLDSDLVLVNEQGMGQILLAQKTGGWRQVSSFTTHGAQVGRIAAGDMAGGGYSDLLITYPQEGAVEWIPGDKYNQAHSIFASGIGIEPFALEILGGKTPAAALGFMGNSDITVLTASLDPPSLKTAMRLPTNNPVLDVLWSDVDRDGTSELVYMEKSLGGTNVYFYSPPDSGAIGLWQSKKLAQIDGAQYDRIVKGVFNNDDRDDFIAWSSGASAALLTSSDAGLYTQSKLTLDKLSQKRFGDIDHDGLDDAVLFNSNSTEFFIFLNQKNNFASLASENAGQPILDAVFVKMDGKSYFLLWTNSKSGIAPLSVLTSGHSQTQAASVDSLLLYHVEDRSIKKTGEFSLPAFIESLDLYQNVVIYKNSDLLEGRYYPYRSFFVPDWTTRASDIVAGEIQIAREILEGNNLAPSSDVMLSGLGFLDDPALYQAAVNQQTDYQSQFMFGAPVLPRNLRIDASPPSGIYNHPFIAFPDSESGSNIYYSIDHGPWLEYLTSTQIIVSRDRSIRFYAQNGSAVSPIIEQLYELDIPPNSDSDQDFIPDLLEDSFDLPLFSKTRDFDGDAWEDLEELIRGTNPKDETDFPPDRDGDGWSDFDEEIRFTDPDLAGSSPASSSRQEAEYQLELVHEIVPVSDSGDASENRELRLGIWDFTNQLIHSVASTEDRWSLRIPGDQPHIIRIRDAEYPSVTMMVYAPEHHPCFHPLRLYDGGQTAAEWLDLLRSRGREAFYIIQSESVNYHSMALCLALQLWLIHQTGWSEPVAWGSGEGGFKVEDLIALQKQYDMNAVYRFLLERIAPDSTWTNLVQSFFDDANANHPLADWDVTLQKAVLGLPYDEASFPAAVAAEAIAANRVFLFDLFDQVPSQDIELTGTAVQRDYRYYLVESDGSEWEIDLELFSIPDGAEITIEGKLVALCGTDGINLVRVRNILHSYHTLAYNDLDSDGDGLPDEWEKFFFAKTNAAPDEDPDGDSHTNLSELYGLSNPLDRHSVPGPASITPTATPTSPPGTPTMAPTPTPPPSIATPTPTATLTQTPTLTPTSSIDESPIEALIVAQGFGGETLINWKNLNPGITEIDGKTVNVTSTYRAISGARGLFLDKIGGGPGRNTYVSTGDVDGDGDVDLVVSMGRITEKNALYPNIIIPRDAQTRDVIAHSFVAFPAGGSNPVNYDYGEIRTAVGNFIGSPTSAQIAAAQGFGGNNIIRIFQYTGKPAPEGYAVISQFNGLAGAAASNNANGGLTLSAGDLDNDGKDELVVCQTNSTLSRTQFSVIDIADDGTLENRASGVAFPRKFQGNGGIESAVADLNGDGVNELVFASQGNARNFGDERDGALINVIAIQNIRLKDGVIQPFTLENRPKGFVRTIFSPEINPSGAMSVCPINADGDAGNGTELILGAGCLYNWSADPYEAILPAPEARYAIIRAACTPDAVISLEAALGSVAKGFPAFPADLNPLSGSVFVASGHTN